MTEYEIRVEGQLDQRWAAWFDGLSLAHEGDTTLLRGTLADEAALYGVLLKIRNLALPLLAVSRVVTDQAKSDQTAISTRTSAASPSWQPFDGERPGGLGTTKPRQGNTR